MELVEESENILTSHQRIEWKSPSTQLSVGLLRHDSWLCEAVDKPESDSESEEDPFADIDEQ